MECDSKCINSYCFGKNKRVGDILRFTYRVIGGYEKQAEANAYDTRAKAVSREKYQHEYGYDMDAVEAKAHQYTRDDSGYIESLDAPHKGNATWLKKKAYDQWSNDLPSDYEDWND